MFRDRIKAKYTELSPSFRKLADFILQEQLDAAFMTATEMAHRMEVDAATVVRFAQTLGYSGFRELIKEVQRIVKSELTAAYTSATEAKDDLGLFRGLLENEKHNLEFIQAQFTEQVNTIIPTLVEAKRIWVVGQGSCAALASLCAHVLHEVGLSAMAIAPDPLGTAANLKTLGAEDMVIGFSLTGMDLSVADTITFAQAHGAKTLVLSGSPVTAAALASEMTIICPGPTQTHVPSFTGLAAMVVVLITAYATRYPEQTELAKQELKSSYNQLLDIQARSSAEVDVEELWRQF